MNSVLEIATNSAHPAAQYTPDETAPELLNFTFDANSGSIAFTFSETVDVSTLNPSAITLQAGPSSPQPGRSYTLTGGVALTDNSTVVVLQLNSLLSRDSQH